jgi:hypothetical protein
MTNAYSNNARRDGSPCSGSAHGGTLHLPSNLVGEREVVRARQPPRGFLLPFWPRYDVQRCQLPPRDRAGSDGERAGGGAAPPWFLKLAHDPVWMRVALTLRS